MFKNDSGTFYTKSLFFETNVGDRDCVIYTLKNEDYKGYKSLKRLYFETRDITGYTLANKYLGGWDHFLKLREIDWFNSYWDKWEKEFEVMLRAESLVRLLDESKNKDSKNYVDLNKFMLQKGWVPPEDRKPVKKRGAPSKAEVMEAATLIAIEDETLASDLRRVVKGTYN